MAAAQPPGPGGWRATRERDAERTPAEVLDAATREFSRQGYDGARVDEITVLTRTAKRMIYYYFGGKEELYTAVLERAYREIRAAETSIEVAHMTRVEAIRTLAELTVCHHAPGGSDRNGGGRG